jgi:aspartokinase
VDEQDGKTMQSLCALAEFFESEGVKTKQISFFPGAGGMLSGSLVLPEKENYHIEAALSRLVEVFGPKVRIVRNCSAVSLIGTGITDRHTYLLDSLSLLRKSGIPISGLQTSSFRISFLPERSRMNEVVQLFHRHFIER